MEPTSALPGLRLRVLAREPVRQGGELVLYWMVAARRAHHNFALERALELARALARPLVVLEALRTDYPFASERQHAFVLAGMRDNRRAFAGSGVLYHAFVEPRRGAGRGLVAALAARACAVVTDEFPCSFLPRMVDAAAARSPVRFEAVDSCGLLPLRAASKVYARAFDFRRWLARELPRHLVRGPRARPLERLRLPALAALPEPIARRWPAASDELLAGVGLGRLPIDHAIAPAPTPGGAKAGAERLERFVARGLSSYGERRNSLAPDAQSGLSPYLHFGHVSPHQVLARVAASAGRALDELGRGKRGEGDGWWGLGPAPEAFLDQLVTWRELGFNACARRDDLDRYESLPDWARRTLEAHAQDPRTARYELDLLERGATHDRLWNAAQRQLAAEGTLPGYLRMLWGKQILAWSESPRRAFEVMVELNDKLALDGRDPNSYSGIGWVLGRYDRPWGPERAVFGLVRCMTSESALRKLRAGDYIERWCPDGKSNPAHRA